MTKTTRDALRSLIGERENLALNRLRESPEYSAICTQQEESEETVDELLLRFEKPDRITIRRHYEGELHRTGYEINAAYIQGLRDCFQLFGFLAGDEVCV